MANHWSATRALADSATLSPPTCCVRTARYRPLSFHFSTLQWQIENQVTDDVEPLGLQLAGHVDRYVTRPLCMISCIPHGRHQRQLAAHFGRSRRAHAAFGCWPMAQSTSQGSPLLVWYVPPFTNEWVTKALSMSADSFGMSFRELQSRKLQIVYHAPYGTPKVWLVLADAKQELKTHSFLVIKTQFLSSHNPSSAQGFVLPAMVICLMSGRFNGNNRRSRGRDFGREAHDVHVLGNHQLQGHYQTSSCS